MQEASRRVFLKGSALAFVALGGINTLFASSDFSKISPKTSHYFIRDMRVNADISHIKADKILCIDGDISEIYSELKAAFESGAIIASVSSEESFFVLSQMANGYGFRVVYDKYQAGVREWILAPKGVKI